MISLSLYENAIDSMNHGLEHLVKAVKEGEKKDYKQSILLLFHGTELLLKEILCLKHPIYMFDKNSLFEKCKDPLNPELEELYNCKSLDINKICREIKKYYPSVFGNSLQVVEKFARIRNQTQHFCLDINEEELKGILTQTYSQVISPGLKFIGKTINTDEYNDYLKQKLDEIYCFFEVANQEEMHLSINNEDFTRGCCYSCKNHSLFMIYDTGFPHEVYCTSCDFKRENISIEEYRECPECGAPSLLYEDSLEGGICLWYKCANHKDGGILIDMDYCSECNDFIIEESCMCTIE
ncbi:hypothetical protein [Bacillus tropicus]|uniref:hypothetical protein n=1 Tax=Bacillus tropicus TaxID=2026188 RepID=UPI00381CDD93